MTFIAQYSPLCTHRMCADRGQARLARVKSNMPVPASPQPPPALTGSNTASLPPSIIVTGASVEPVTQGSDVVQLGDELQRVSLTSE